MVFVFSLFFVSGFALAYQPTSKDIATIAQLKTQLDTIISGDLKDTWNFYNQVDILQKKSIFDERITYMLDQLWTHLSTKLNTEKIKAKLSSKASKQAFLDTYLTGISVDITDADSCTGWYNTLDTISFANNFPTALTIATRYRESNCGYYLPKNTRWPFQITSKNYGTGDITEEIFVKSVQDFIDFSKTKRGQYRSKLWIDLTYTGADYTGVINHAALYNWGVISWNIVNPNNPHYVFDGYADYTSGVVRYGLFPKFLKIMDWEVKTMY